MVSHFHKDFIFNENCKWIVPVCSGDSDLVGNEYFINVCEGNTLDDLKIFYKNQTDKEFYRALGAEASIYWIIKNQHRITSSYLGFTSYRRYLYFLDNESNTKIHAAADKEYINRITSDTVLSNIETVFKEYDIITCKEVTVEDGLSIEQQYLRYQPKEMWDLFKDGIITLYPKYTNSINWLSTNKSCSFESPIIAKREIFLDMANQYFEVLRYIWKKLSNVYPERSNYEHCREEYPWRYPGFLGERFFPFFVYANKLKRKEVPLIFIQ